MESLGFEEIRRESETFRTFYSRPSIQSILTDWVFIAFQGKALEFPIPYVAISPIRKGALVKGVVETRYVQEIDKNWPAGKAKILTNNDSCEWEQQLIEIAPQKLEELIQESAPSLLQDTASAREAVKGYFGMLDRELKSSAKIVDWYHAQPSSQEKSMATRLLRAPGICNLSRGHWLYEIALFIILVWSNEVEGKVYDFHNVAPFQQLDREFVRRKELIVDEILVRENLDLKCT